MSTKNDWHDFHPFPTEWHRWKYRISRLWWYYTKRFFRRLIPTWLLKKIVYWAFNQGYNEIKRRNGFPHQDILL